MFRGAADGAGHACRQGSGDDAGLFVQKRPVLALEGGLQPGGGGFLLHVVLLQLCQQVLLGVQVFHVGNQGFQPLLPVGLLLHLAEQLFLFRSGVFQRLPLLLQALQRFQQGCVLLLCFRCSGRCLFQLGVGLRLLSNQLLQLVIAGKQQLQFRDLLLEGILLRLSRPLRLQRGLPLLQLGGRLLLGIFRGFQGGGGFFPVLRLRHLGGGVLQCLLHGGQMFAQLPL